VIEETLAAHIPSPADTLTAVRRADAWARAHAAHVAVQSTTRGI